MKMKRCLHAVLTGLVFMVAFTVFSTTGYAAEEFQNAPAAVTVTDAPMIIPFRVWVVPSYDNGAYIAGHYELLEMPLQVGERLALEAPGMEPVHVPVVPPQGEPALPVM